MTENLKSPVLRFLILIIGSIWAMFASFCILLSGQFLGSFLTKTVAKLLLPAHIVQSDIYVTSRMYMMFLGIWIICIAVAAIFPKNRHILKTFAGGLRGNNLNMLLVGIGIGFAANLVCAFAAMANGNIHLQFDSLQLFPFLMMFVVVFIQSAAEELVCRGYLYRKILFFGGKPLLACFINSAFFYYIHSMNPGITPLSMANLFLMGVLFSAMVMYLDSLWAAMGAHCAWNFCQNILLGLPNSGIVEPFSVFKLDAAAATDSFAYSVGFGLEGSMVAFAVLALSTVLIWLWHRKSASVKAE